MPPVPSIDPTDHLLRFWGRDADAFAERMGGDFLLDGGALACWFDSVEDRDAAIAAAKGVGEIVAISRTDGPDARRQLVVGATLEHGGKNYEIGVHFGYGYPEESARYMLEEGNYSCDCNRSAFIIEQCDEEFPELDCGNTIKLVRLVPWLWEWKRI